MRLGEAVLRICAQESDDVIVVAQWEVARYLEGQGLAPAHTVQERGGLYLDSDRVWREASSVFKSYGIYHVIPVAQPFLQRAKVIRMMRREGVRVEKRRVGYIGFDSSGKNHQWWTKGPLRLSAYSVEQVLSRQLGRGLH